MKGSLQTACLLTLCLLILVPVDASARKKNGRGRHTTGMVAQLTQPDVLPSRTPQEKLVALVAAASDENAPGRNINTRFREGIDVSHYQGRIDWDAVAGSQQVSYVYLKATEGASLVDDTYERNLREARRVGLSVGSYHFYRPNIDWRVQLENLTSTVKASTQDLVPIIDIEHRGHVSEERFIRDLKAFIEAVTRHYGKRPLLYSYQNFYNRHLRGLFSGYHWMIAKYQDEKPILHDGKDYIIWQYTAKGSIPGVKGHVDRSCIMNGFTLQQLAF